MGKFEPGIVEFFKGRDVFITGGSGKCVQRQMMRIREINLANF